MNDIELLKNYLDKDGKSIMVLSFSGGKYLCSYSDGTKVHLRSNEIFGTKKEVKVVEPKYFEEQIFDFTEDDVSFGDSLFDNIDTLEDIVVEEEPVKEIEKEDSDGDFFKDFL